MIGLIKKDLYIIVKNIKVIQFIPILAPIFALSVNPAYLMPVLSIMIALLFAFQVSQTMSFDESTKWSKYITAMPITHTTEAGSKYILLFIMGIFSTIVVLITGMIISTANLINLNSALLFTGLSFTYVLLYGLVMIPSTYRFGASNSRYIFMLFVFIPTLVPIVINSLKINISFKWLEKIDPAILIAIFIVIMLLLILTSFYMTIKVLKNRKYMRF